MLQKNQVEKRELEQLASDLKNFKGGFAKLWAWLLSCAPARMAKTSRLGALRLVVLPYS